MTNATPLKVRPPTSDELVRAAEISKIAFETEDIEPWLSSFNWLADNRGLEYIIAAEVEGELVASMLCTPGTARFGDDLVPLCAVGAVATLPSHRRHGYAGMMMHESVKLLKRSGYYTSALWPFSYSYYRKFGWEVGGEHRRYTIPCEIASELARPNGTRPASQTDLPAIGEMIDRWAKRYNCTTVRDDLWWSCKQASRTFRFDSSGGPGPVSSLWVHESDGHIDAYADVKITADGESIRIVSGELISQNPYARRAILSRLAAIGAPEITFVAPADDEFLQEIANPRLVKTEVLPGFQFRVIDPLAALTARRVDPSLAGRLGFTIHDPVTGAMDFTIESDGVVVSKAKTEASERLSMSIQTFSQLYSGYINPHRAADIGRIQPTSNKAMSLAVRLFQSVTPFRSLVELG